ncbi:MAG: acyl-CoA thioesterase [Cytophagales bacterium]|nr:acyl-CoA thioesterase [Bernardetiaceae bacterium]MDW8209681.1 acyl-CoA thioesterase [Cytophagales bacterium]
MQQAARSVGYSRTVISELMTPLHANFEGRINAGTLLSLMDKVAFTCASRHAGNYCVTVSIEEVEFVYPVKIGDLVIVKGSINYVGHTSMIVGVRVDAQDIRTGEIFHTNSSYFHMVAKNANGEITAVPPLLLENHDDVRRFFEGMLRKRARNNMRNELKRQFAKYDFEKILESLRRERCQIGFDISAEEKSDNILL